MPVYHEEDLERLKQLREDEDKERDFVLQQLERKEAHEVVIIQEKGKVALERLRMTHKANSKASTWIALFSILPKALLIISSFWLIVIKREVPKSWNEYISR